MKMYDPSSNYILLRKSDSNHKAWAWLVFFSWKKFSYTLCGLNECLLLTFPSCVTACGVCELAVWPFPDQQRVCVSQHLFLPLPIELKENNLIWCAPLCEWNGRWGQSPAQAPQSSGHATEPVRVNSSLSHGLVSDPVRSREVDFLILLGSFQIEILCDSMVSTVAYGKYNTSHVAFLERYVQCIFSNLIF